MELVDCFSDSLLYSDFWLVAAASPIFLAIWLAVKWLETWLGTHVPPAIEQAIAYLERAQWPKFTLFAIVSVFWVVVISLAIPLFAALLVFCAIGRLVDSACGPFGYPASAPQDGDVSSHFEFPQADDCKRTPVQISRSPPSAPPIMTHYEREQERLLYYQFWSNFHHSAKPKCRYTHSIEYEHYERLDRAREAYAAQVKNFCANLPNPVVLPPTTANRSIIYEALGNIQSEIKLTLCNDPIQIKGKILNTDVVILWFKGGHAPIFADVKTGNFADIPHYYINILNNAPLAGTQPSYNPPVSLSPPPAFPPASTHQKAQNSKIVAAPSIFDSKPTTYGSVAASNIDRPIGHTNTANGTPTPNADSSAPTPAVTVFTQPTPLKGAGQQVKPSTTNTAPTTAKNSSAATQASPSQQAPASASNGQPVSHNANNTEPKLRPSSKKLLPPAHVKQAGPTNFVMLR